MNLIFFSIAENFGYRQIITAYRVRRFFAHLRGDKAWGEIQRIGFAGELEAAAEGVPERPVTA